MENLLKCECGSTEFKTKKIYEEIVEISYDEESNYCEDDVIKSIFDSPQNEIYTCRYCGKVYELVTYENESKLEVAIPGDDPEDYISIKWHIDDVIGKAKDKGIEISKDNARYLLGLIESHHDCNYGITWDTINCYIDDFENEQI